MASGLYRLQRRITNLGSIFLSLVFVVLGVGLIYLTEHYDPWTGMKAFQALTRDFGSLFVVTGAFTILWEVAGRRVLFDEFWSKAQLAESIRAAGLRHIAKSFRTEVDWPDLFRDTSKLDIFFAYGRTWRNTHAEHLERLISREDSRLRIVMPDPEHLPTMTDLAHRFSMSPEEVAGLVQETTREFQLFRTRIGVNADRVQLWYLPTPPVFTFYRFDRKAVLALYTHRKGREPVPAFVVEAEGYLYDFVRHELDAMIVGEHPLARRVP